MTPKWAEQLAFLITFALVLVWLVGILQIAQGKTAFRGWGDAPPHTQPLASSPKMR